MLDYKLYERGIGNAVFGDKHVLGDKGYQRIAKLHTNHEIPKKQPQGGTVTEAEQEENRHIGRERMLIARMYAKINVFKITWSKYRNRRKRFGLRMTLICGIINFE